MAWAVNIRSQDPSCPEESLSTKHTWMSVVTVQQTEGTLSIADKKPWMRTKEGWGNKCLGEALTISEMRGDRKNSEERSKQSGSHKQESWQPETVQILNELSGQRRGKIIELLPMNDKDGSGALRGRRHPAYLAAIALGGPWTGTQWQLMLLSLWHISKREMGISGKASNLGGELKKKEAPENSAQTREEKPFGMCRIADKVFTDEQ